MTPFPPPTVYCTYCALATDDASCHQKYEVCVAREGCYRHIYIKYGQIFVDKVCSQQITGEVVRDQSSVTRKKLVTS